jgi:hypothetical protein
MSNIDPTREHPREAGSSPRVEERAYTPRAIPESNSLLRIFGMADQRSIHALFLMIVVLGGGSRLALAISGELRTISCPAGSEIYTLTVTEGNGMFQFINQSRLKIRHL